MTPTFLSFLVNTLPWFDASLSPLLLSSIYYLILYFIASYSPIFPVFSYFILPCLVSSNSLIQFIRRTSILLTCLEQIAYLRSFPFLIVSLFSSSLSLLIITWIILKMLMSYKYWNKSSQYRIFFVFIYPLFLTILYYHIIFHILEG